MGQTPSPVGRVKSHELGRPSAVRCTVQGTEHAVSPIVTVLRGLSQVDCLECEASFGYIVGSRTALATV